MTAGYALAAKLKQMEKEEKIMGQYTPRKFKDIDGRKSLKKHLLMVLGYTALSWLSVGITYVCCYFIMTPYIEEPDLTVRICTTMAFVATFLIPLLVLLPTGRVYGFYWNKETDDE